MTTFTASTQPTIREEGSCEDIHTAYIDVQGGVGEKNPTPERWYARISVHGEGKEGAEAMRDQVLQSLKFTELLRGFLE